MKFEYSKLILTFVVMVTQMVTGYNPQADAQKTGDEGLQKDGIGRKLVPSLLKSVTRIAQKDIADYLQTVSPGNSDTYKVSCQLVFSEESKILNQRLGIHKINKSKNHINWHHGRTKSTHR